MLNLVKLGDLFLSVPLVFVQENAERRKMYGKAGAFRCVEGRVELRSPSNCYWENKERLNWMFNQLKTMLELYNNNPEIMNEIEAEANNIINCLNNDDKDIALVLIEKFNILTCPVEDLVV